MILYYYSIYINFYFELTDDTHSVRVPCTDRYLYFFLCPFVECSKCTIDFNSPSALASLQHIRVQGELLILARAGFSHSRLDVFEFWTWTIVLLILFFLHTLRLDNLKIDVLDVMTIRFWDDEY